jgi:hypothetical protein
MANDEMRHEIRVFLPPGAFRIVRQEAKRGSVGKRVAQIVKDHIREIAIGRKIWPQVEPIMIFDAGGGP